MQINGYCDPAFTAVRDAFAANFEQRGEVGASCCVYVDGKKRVDIWGGHTDAARTQAWQADTLSVVFSNAKAATALCAHILIERGQLDPEAPVTDYWPEFGQHGKDGTTVAMMLAHQSSVPALRAPVKPGGYYDFDYMAARLAAEVPFWEPGSDVGYHFSTYCWTVGELVRRVSGQSLGTFFRTEIAEPLGLDFHIGLPDADVPRMAHMIPIVADKTQPPSPFVRKMLKDPRSIPHLAYVNNGGHTPDRAEAWRAEFGGGGGIANARALAQFYATLTGSKPLLPRDYIDIMRQPFAATPHDLTLQAPTRFAQGFMLRMDNRDQFDNLGNSLLIGPDAFGHTGMGGSIGFGDPSAQMSFGYTMTKMKSRIFLDTRGQSLVAATYDCL